MTWPGLPTCHFPAGVVIESTVDEECQANIVTQDGEQVAVWLDDSTPNLNKWRAMAVAKYGPLGQKVFVCVPPGRPHLHYGPEPTVVNVYEAYWYGMGCPPEEWLPLPTFDAYCIQWAYPGTHGQHAPTVKQKETLLHAVLEKHPHYIFLF